MNMTLAQLDQLSARECVAHFWGSTVIDTIDHQHITPMTQDEFLTYCTACGGDWGAMLLSGIKVLYPAVYATIPDNMGYLALRLIGETLELLGVGNNA